MRENICLPPPRRRLATAFALILAFAGATSGHPARAQYPERPIKLVVPFTPGGGSDAIARSLAVSMGKTLGQAVIVENKPGAGTIIGTDAVAKSPADGYTVLLASFAHVINPSMGPKLPYDHATAFAPVMLIGVSPNVLVVRAQSPLRSARDILAAARDRPGALSFASMGAGTSAHLAGELFKNLGRTDIVHVPYRGAAPAITDLMGGQVDIMFATAATVANSLRDGKLRALAVTTSARSTAAALAELPTVAETGLPGYVVDSWYGLFVPAGTPAATVAKINAAARVAVQTEAFRKRAESEGLVIRGGTPEEFQRYAAFEEERWRKVIKDNNIQRE